MTQERPWTIVYDLDGTLLDTLDDIAGAANAALKEVRPEAATFDSPTVKRMIGDGARILMERMLTAATGVSPQKAALDSAHEVFLKYYSSDLFGNTRPYPHVVEGLKEFQGRTHVTQLICTNKPEALARSLVENSELSGFFSPAYAAVTGAVPGTKQKPDQEHVLRALETMTGKRAFDPARMVVVGDGRNDIQVAHALGCRSIAVMYGFGEPRILESLKPTACVDSFDRAIHQIDVWMKQDRS